MQRKGAKEREAEILEYWETHKTFQRSVDERPKENPYVFVDGPPFATGLPHYGHLVGGTMKDVIPRYWTMKGKRVERVWGWDCHGLPIENIVEKDLDLGDRQKIESFGVGKFNEACRARVLEYADGWRDVVRRFGRWVDMDNAYRTMDPEYMESVWWAFKELYNKGYLYEGYRPIHICPRCATTLSASEAGSEYQDITDVSVVARFAIEGQENTFALAWTTTPWSLPGNMLLAVGADITYVKIAQRNEVLIVASDRLDEVIEGEYEVIEEIKGSDLVGLAYTPLFPYFADREGAFKVVAAEFVSTDEGTGIVHIAPAFGEDDYQVGKEHELELIQHVRIDGTFVDEVVDFAGRQAKPSDNDIVTYLAGRGGVYTTKQIRHSYPHCWRCDTPLLNYVTNSWFIGVSKYRDQLLEANKQTAWVPENVREGRFGRWLEGARDWSVSRNRYWGAPLPVWKSEDGDVLVVGSRQELEELSGKAVDDLHKHLVDDVVIEKDGKTYTRIPEVLDCWFESGSGPFARMHYPFENKEVFEAGLPADFIAEGQDQTRGWFYSLHVLSTLLFDKPAFEHVIVNGLVLAEDGKKMSKRLQNYPDPVKLLDVYGADAIRLYLMSSPVVQMENLNFKESGVKEVSNKFVGTLGNVLSFYKLFVHEVPEEVTGDNLHVLDRWVLSLLAKTVSEMDAQMQAYHLAPAARSLQSFVTELSQWYVRRSRDRFKGEDAADKASAAWTLYRVLDVLSRIAAPFTPFMAEYVWQQIAPREAGDSVHLQEWPNTDAVGSVDDVALENMELLRTVVTRVLEARTEARSPVRQVLGKVSVLSPVALEEVYLSILKDEVNVQDVVWGEGALSVDLDTTLTPELRKLGLVREIMRQGNALRKQAKLTVQDKVVLLWSTDDADARAAFAEHADEIAERVNATEVVEGMDAADEAMQFETEEGVVDLGVKRV